MTLPLYFDSAFFYDLWVAWVLTFLGLVIFAAVKFAPSVGIPFITMVCILFAVIHWWV